MEDHNDDAQMITLMAELTDRLPEERKSDCCAGKSSVASAVGVRGPQPSLVRMEQSQFVDIPIINCDQHNMCFDGVNYQT